MALFTRCSGGIDKIPQEIRWHKCMCIFGQLCFAFAEDFMRFEALKMTIMWILYAGFGPGRQVFSTRTISIAHCGQTVSPILAQIHTVVCYDLYYRYM